MIGPCKKQHNKPRHTMYQTSTSFCESLFFTHATLACQAHFDMCFVPSKSMGLYVDSCAIFLLAYRFMSAETLLCDLTCESHFVFLTPPSTLRNPKSVLRYPSFRSLITPRNHLISRSPSALRPPPSVICPPPSVIRSLVLLFYPKRKIR